MAITQPSASRGAGSTPGGTPRRPRPQFLPAWVAVGDVLLVHGGFLLAFALRFGLTLPKENFDAYLRSLPGLTLLAIILFLAYGLYDLRSQSWRSVASGVVVALSLFPAFSMALTFIARAFAFPRTVVVLAWILHLILLLVWRSLIWGYVERAWGRPAALVVGPPGEAQAFARKIGSSHRAGYDISGVVLGEPVPDGDLSEAAASSDFTERTPDRPSGPVFPEFPFEALAELLGLGGEAREGAGAVPDTVIITPSTRADDKARVADLAARTDVRVLIVPGYRDLLVFDSRMAQIDGTLAFEVGPAGVPSHLLWAKRLTDVLLALTGLIVTLPLIPFIALAVKLSSRGPVLYPQTRVGRGGRPYTLLKFRTMVSGAENDTGPVLSSRVDPRVTPVGRFLRRYRLDELPQLVNVLLGSMSLVGPRPERPEFVTQFSRAIPYYHHRHLLKPGLTGLAQLNAGYDAPVEEKLRYDLLYAKRYSLVLDLRVLLLTASLLLTGDEALWRESRPGGDSSAVGRDSP